MDSDVKIKSKTDVKKIAKQCLNGELSPEEILNRCRELWGYARELSLKGKEKDRNSNIDFNNIYNIRNVCDTIGQLAVHLENDEQKLKVLSMCDSDVITRLDLFDNEHPADPVDRISAEYSFGFLNKIVDSLENKEFKERIINSSHYRYSYTGWKEDVFKGMYREHPNNIRFLTDSDNNYVSYKIVYKILANKILSEIEKQKNNQSINPSMVFKDALQNTTPGQIAEATTIEHIEEQGDQTHDKQ